MTVECVAKLTKRPLISLSAADLGTEETRMERNLVNWFDRATLWGAIVLVDEAEVYLEQRQTGQLNRNALVTGSLNLEMPTLATHSDKTQPSYAPWSTSPVCFSW